MILVIVDDDDLVRDLKLKISDLASLPIDSIRLVFKGKILTDYDIISDNLNEQDVVHVARMSQTVETPKPEKTRPERTFGQELLESPAIKELLSQPGLMRSVLANDPRFKQMVEANPEMESVLDDPQTLSDLANAAQNPEIMKEIMRNQGKIIEINISFVLNNF